MENIIVKVINLPNNGATNDGYVVFKSKTKSTLVVGNYIIKLHTEKGEISGKFIKE